VNYKALRGKFDEWWLSLKQITLLAQRAQRAYSAKAAKKKIKIDPLIPL